MILHSVPISYKLRWFPKTVHMHMHCSKIGLKQFKVIPDGFSATFILRPLIFHGLPDSKDELQPGERRAITVAGAILPGVNLEDYFKTSWKTTVLVYVKAM